MLPLWLMTKRKEKKHSDSYSSTSSAQLTVSTEWFLFNVLTFTDPVWSFLTLSLGTAQWTLFYPRAGHTYNNSGIVTPMSFLQSTGTFNTGEKIYVYIYPHNCQHNFKVQLSNSTCEDQKDNRFICRFLGCFFPSKKVILVYRLVIRKSSWSSFYQSALSHSLLSSELSIQSVSIALRTLLWDIRRVTEWAVGHWAAGRASGSPGALPFPNAPGSPGCY